jgi:predicted metal-dependent peptidase
VAGHQVFEDGQFSVHDLKVKGGGGTDLTRIFDWVQSERIAPQAAIVFTDGYTPYGQSPTYPVMWAMSTDVVAPFGTTIHVG